MVVSVRKHSFGHVKKRLWLGKVLGRQQEVSSNIVLRVVPLGASVTAADHHRPRAFYTRRFM